MSFAVLALTVLSMLRQATSITPRSCTDGPIAAAWFAPDANTQLSDLSWEKYNTLFYSFATTTPSVNNISLALSYPSLLPQFVSEARKHGVSPQVSWGGWTGSQFFSSNLASKENRTATVQTVVDFVQQYELDGINIDWEYPGKQGMGCNVVSPSDTENLLAFLQELRADPVGSQMVLSAAVALTPFIDASGKPSTDMSGFANVLDYFTLMNYDVWGGWSTLGVGPNGPLNDSCVPPAYQMGSAVSAVEAWGAAGVPANQIVLGLPAYGHSFSVQRADAFMSGSNTDLSSYPKFNASNQPLGDSDSGSSGGVDICGNPTGPGGTFTLKGLVAHGFLDTNGNPAPGIYYRFDNCSQTVEWPHCFSLVIPLISDVPYFQPYVYNETSQVMISFDDAQAFAAKGKYIVDAGLRGFSMWNTGDDYQDILLDAVRAAAGFDAPPPPSKLNPDWGLPSF